MKLHEFVEWFREDLLYKAPETWPFHVKRFLDAIQERYENVTESDDVKES